MFPDAVVPSDFNVAQIVVVDSIKYIKSLRWVVPEHPNADSASSAGVACRDSRSVMDIAVEIMAAQLNPLRGVQLGNLQVAALAQWKGVQAALGESFLWRFAVFLFSQGKFSRQTFAIEYSITLFQHY